MRNETILTKNQPYKTGLHISRNYIHGDAYEIDLHNAGECVVIVERVGNDIVFRRA